MTDEILESLGEGVVAVDREAKVTFINKTASQMLSISQDLILHKKLDLLSSKLGRKSHELLLKVLDDLEPMKEPLTIRDDSPVVYDLIATPLSEKAGAILVIQDKTDAYRVLEMGKDFIANASHELRTPITIIRGFAETLQDMPDLSREKREEITDKIVRTCARLEKLVRSLIVLSDVEHLPADRMQSANLLAVLNRCKEQLLLLYPETELEINSPSEKAIAFIDVDLIEMALSNLLENGVKYSRGAAHIEVFVELLGPNIVIKIEDRGIGINASDLPHIFERFYTVDKARSRKSGGAGLGLSIVKNIIEKHKGKIFVTSKVGEGTVFTLILSQKI